MRTVLTNHSHHNARKNFLDLPFDKYQIRVVPDIYKMLLHGSFRLTGRINNYWLNSFRDFDVYEGAIGHFFNSLSFGRRPWVTTYEWALPVWGRPQGTDFDKASRMIASSACKKIIAMSNWAERCQDQIAAEHYPSVRAEVMSKCCVLHPAQHAYLSDIDEKRQSGEAVVFSIIGHDFFRKGGKEVLRTFDRLLTKGYPPRLNIIYRLNFGAPPSRSPIQDRDDALRVIAKRPANIKHFYSLPYAAVVELLKLSDIGLLPNYHETYVYSVLEAQSCGCPVITTDIFALPEINNDELGWVLRTHVKDREGGVSYISPTERSRVPEQIEDQLASIIETIVADRASVRSKGAKCLAKVVTHHSTAQPAKRLEDIYAEALQ
jgi:glycosyltransferase involved in cell wall biosynthesis